MNERPRTKVRWDGVLLIELKCPVCGQTLLWAAAGSVLEIKCWRNDCSKPILEYPMPQLQRVRRDSMPDLVPQAVVATKLAGSE